MINLLVAVQDAIYATLAPAVTGAPVLQHLRQGQQPPFVRIFSMSSENEGAKDEQAERVTAEIHVVTQGEENETLLDLMHQVRAALDQQTLASDAAALARPVFVNATEGGPADDGITYAGVLTFTVFAEPAD